MGIIWSPADRWLGRRPPGPMPQLEDGVGHGLKVSRFPDFWPLWGDGHTPTGLRHVPGFLKGGGVWGSLAPFSFSTSFKQKKRKKTDVDSEASRRLIRVQSKSRFALPYSWPNINWIVA